MFQIALIELIKLQYQILRITRKGAVHYQYILRWWDNSLKKNRYGDCPSYLSGICNAIHSRAIKIGLGIERVHACTGSEIKMKVR